MKKLLIATAVLALIAIDASAYTKSPAQRARDVAAAKARAAANPSTVPGTTVINPDIIYNGLPQAEPAPSAPSPAPSEATPEPSLY